jgi:hypothetical protein
MTKEQREELMQNLLDKVIEEIQSDVNEGDLTAIEELLKFVPIPNLIGYLSDMGDLKKFEPLTPDRNVEVDYFGFGVDDVHHQIDENYPSVKNCTDEDARKILAIASNDADFGNDIGYEDLDNAIEGYFGVEKEEVDDEDED